MGVRPWAGTDWRFPARLPFALRVPHLGINAGPWTGLSVGGIVLNRSSRCIRIAVVLGAMSIMVAGCADSRMGNAASNTATGAQASGEAPYHTAYGITSDGPTTDLYITAGRCPRLRVRANNRGSYRRTSPGEIASLHRPIEREETPMRRIAEVPWVETPTLHLDLDLPPAQRFAAIPAEALDAGRCLLAAILEGLPA